MTIQIYTDGSCHTQLKIGGWAALIFFNEKSEQLTGHETDTTHNRMELLAVLKALDFVEKNNKIFSEIEIFSDSQYVVRILERKEKLARNQFLTKAGKPIRNVDLVKLLIEYLDRLPFHFIKVKAHQKKNGKGQS